MQEQNRIKSESEARLQKDILDPVLGTNMAKAFVDVEMEIKAESEDSTRSGMGLAEKYKEKQGMQQHGGMATVELLPGIYRPKTLTGGADKPENSQAQQASQEKGIQQTRFAEAPDFKKLTVSILHDESVLDPVKDAPRRKIITGLIVEAMGQYHLKEDDVFFRPAPFQHFKSDWREDFKKPEVYLPLLYALLFLLLLLFLFGPLWRFFVQYVKALRERPAAEVNVESKIEQPDDTGEGEEDGRLLQEGKLDLTWQKKPDEPPPPPPLPPEEEDDEMKKFEPFSYINEENVKRLAYLFILRKEEPWLVAMVASYLRPDFARQMISALPVTMQAKVAIEALTLRQVTREQVIAIDNDIKENVEFVVGGIERITAMLDEADTNTRNNILNYLKNEKPLVYEVVRRHILVFDDIANFPDREMQTIVRELKAENMARALQRTSPELVNKFLANMSAGAASLLKESIEYTSGLSQTQIDDERAKIMDLIKVMEKEGKISVRQAQEGGDEALEGMQEELSAQERRDERFAANRRKTEPATPVAVDPAEAQRYFEYAVEVYNGGDLQGSVAYFEEAVRQSPGLWKAYQYLGSIYYQAGRVDDTIAAYEKVLKLNPNPDPQLRQFLDGLKAQAGR
jgi:tetratricopeptide (TPR) repeat protein